MKHLLNLIRSLLRPKRKPGNLPTGQYIRLTAYDVSGGYYRTDWYPNTEHYRKKLFALKDEMMQSKRIPFVVINIEEGREIPYTGKQEATIAPPDTSQATSKPLNTKPR